MTFAPAEPPVELLKPTSILSPRKMRLMTHEAKILPGVIASQPLPLLMRNFVVRIRYLFRVSPFPGRIVQFGRCASRNRAIYVDRCSLWKSSGELNVCSRANVFSGPDPRRIPARDGRYRSSDNRCPTWHTTTLLSQSLGQSVSETNPILIA